MSDALLDRIAAATDLAELDSVRVALLDAFETAEGQVRERLARPAAGHRSTAKPPARTAKRPVAKAPARKPSAKKTAGKHSAG